MNSGAIDNVTLPTLEWVAGAWFLSADVVSVDVALAERHPTGVYVLADASKRILHLGQANRNDGIAGRVRAHLVIPSRRATTEVVVVRLDEGIGARALDAIEGQSAEMLGLRASLPNDRWPNRDQWAALTATRTAHLSEAGRGERR